MKKRRVRLITVRQPRAAGEAAGLVDPVVAVAVGADRFLPGRELALQEPGDHLGGRNIVVIMAGRARSVDLRSRIGDVGPGCTDVFVIGMGHAGPMTLCARYPLELMAAGQRLLDERQVTDQAGGVGAEDVGSVPVARSLLRGGSRAGLARVLAARWSRSRHGEDRGQDHEQNQCVDAQTVSHWRSHWYPGVRWAR